MNDQTRENRRLGPLGTRIAVSAGAVGVVALACVALASRAEEALPRVAFAYLVNYTFFLSLSLGALFFVLLHHLIRARWSVVARRLAEAVAANLALLAVLGAPIFLWRESLYPWASTGRAADQAWLNAPFFAGRLVVYFAIWIVLARYYIRRSIAQDETGDPNLARGMERLSPLGAILLVLTSTFAWFDLLMSLDPRFFSAVYGLYGFSGAVLGFLALLAVTIFALQRSDRLTVSITVEHTHDLGKMILVFVMFWGYVAFMQYLLIWYANLPDEAAWLARRRNGLWAGPALLLLVGHAVPLLALLSRGLRSRSAVLAALGAWLLAMRWLDAYWLAMPEFSPHAPVFGLPEIGCFLGLGGLFVAGAAFQLRRCLLIPNAPQEKGPVD
jgi:hypothetical protein